MGFNFHFFKFNILYLFYQSRSDCQSPLLLPANEGEERSSMRHALTTSDLGRLGFTLRGTDDFSSSRFKGLSSLFEVVARHTLEMIPESMILTRKLAFRAQPNRNTICKWSIEFKCFKKRNQLFEYCGHVCCCMVNICLKTILLKH